MFTAHLGLQKRLPCAQSVKSRLLVYTDDALFADCSWMGQ